MVDHSVARIHWIGDAPSPEIVAKVRENISKELEDLSVPAKLIYHHLALTRDYEGPAVVLSGNAEISGFDAEYFETFKPVTFDYEDFNPEARKIIEAAQNDKDNNE